jgi:hypothetical protein
MGKWIVDDSRDLEGDGGFKDLEQYGRAIEKSYRRDFWAHQKDRVIVISEKSTVAGILRPVLEEYGVPFFAAHGFNSATKVHDLAEEMRSDPRTYVLIYVGDYDPSGMYMSEVDFPMRLGRYGADVERFNLVRVALRREDTPTLPSFPAKKDDPRYGWYVSHYGVDAWELDAMNPNELRDRVRESIEQCMNRDDWEQHKIVEVAQQETVKTIARKMAELNS